MTALQRRKYGDSSSVEKQTYDNQKKKKIRPCSERERVCLLP